MDSARSLRAVLEDCYSALLRFLLDLWLTLTYLPYFFLQTPDEIGSRTRRLAEENDDWVYMTVQTGDGAIQERFMNVNPAPPGHISVKLYRDMDRLWQDSAVMTFARLETDGSLDLKQLRQKWNLENCYPVDSARAVIFETQQPEWLSPMAVSVLIENQFWLRVVELPSQRVLDMRARRLRCVAAYNLLTNFLADLPTHIYNLPDHFRSIPRDIQKYPADFREDVRCHCRRSTGNEKSKSPASHNTFCRCSVVRRQNSKTVSQML